MHGLPKPLQLLWLCGVTKLNIFIFRVNNTPICVPSKEVKIWKHFLDWIIDDYKKRGKLRQHTNIVLIFVANILYQELCPQTQVQTSWKLRPAVQNVRPTRHQTLGRLFTISISLSSLKYLWSQNCPFVPELVWNVLMHWWVPGDGVSRLAILWKDLRKMLL